MPRPEPDGRSSVVSEDDKTGKLYCLNIGINDLKNPQDLGPATATQLRIIEGVTRRNVDSSDGSNPAVKRRILGQIPLEKDGSFNVEIPAATPIELQVLDEDGLALRTCRWIWAMNHEQRGCIGCHEDPELTPPNDKLVEALMRKPTSLVIKPDQRRSVDYLGHAGSIFSAKCATCHNQRHRSLKLVGGATTEPDQVAYQALLRAPAGKYITPGQARTSPLVWRILGRKTTRPWDATSESGAITPMPPKNAPPLTKEEIRTLVEWIDLGAMWKCAVSED